MPNYIKWIPWQRRSVTVTRGAKWGLLIRKQQKKGGHEEENRREGGREEGGGISCELKWEEEEREDGGEGLHILGEHFNAAALCLNVHHTDSGGTSLAQGKEMCSAIYCVAGKCSSYSIITLVNGCSYKWLVSWTCGLPFYWWSENEDNRGSL